MASSAILDGEGDGEVADTAEFSVLDKVHAKVLRPFFLDVEDVRMAVGAIKPCSVFLMGERRARLDHAPFRLKAQDLFKRDGFKIGIEDALLRLDEAVLQGLDPVYLVAVPGFWITLQLFEPRVRGPDVARMTDLAGLF